MLFNINIVLADTMDACTNVGVLKVIYFIKLLLNIAFIAVPIGLIVFGLIDFSKSVASGDEKDGKKNLNLLYNYDLDTEDIKSEDDPTYISLDNYQYDLLRNTPLIIWTSDGELKGKIEDVMGMWDVLPTVSNMFNLDYTYALGNDIFSNKEKIVVFPNGNVLTNKVYYNNLKDEYISINSEPIDIDYIDRIKEYADERLEVSKGIIVYDLIKNERDNLKKVIKDEKDK